MPAPKPPALRMAFVSLVLPLDKVCGQASSRHIASDHLEQIASTHNSADVRSPVPDGSRSPATNSDVHVPKNEGYQALPAIRARLAAA